MKTQQLTKSILESVAAAKQQLAAVDAKLSAKGQTVIIHPGERITDAQRRLAQRLLEVVGASGRLVVREKRFDGQGGELYRVITPLYSFQFLPESPEIVDVEVFSESLTAGFIAEMQTMRQAVAEATEAARVARNHAASSEELRRRADEFREQLRAKLNRSEEKLTELQARLAHDKEVLLALTQAVQRRWAKRTPRANRRAVNQLIRAVWKAFQP